MRRRFPYRLPALVLAFALVAICTGCASSQPPIPTLTTLAKSSPKVPVVLIPGITGSELRERQSGKLVWGAGKLLITPHDDGYDLVRPLLDPIDGPAKRVEAGDVLLEMKLGPVKKTIYRPILKMLERHGYIPGRLDAPEPESELFTYAYDWRGDNQFAAEQLRRRLDALADVRGEGFEIDLICQSNGAHICRYLLKYGGEPLEVAEAGDARPSKRFHIRKIIFAGTSNGGSMRILREVHRGRKYLPLIGRTMQPEVLFSFPSILQDLPAHIEKPFVDLEGRFVELDLFDAETWVEHSWSVFQDSARSRMAKRPDLFGDEETRKAYLQTALDRSKRLHSLLAKDSPHFSSTRYYSLQNGYSPTPHLAVVDSEISGLLFTGDDELKERPYLDGLISGPGDGHATVASQLALSPQELDALVRPPYLVHGGHFELILEAGTLRRMLDFLQDP